MGVELRRLIICSVLAPALGACTANVVSVEKAMDDCMETARAATTPTGTAAIGVNSHGKVGTSLSIGISTDYIAGRDPDEVYERCVVRRSGSKPYADYSEIRP